MGSGTRQSGVPFGGCGLIERVSEYSGGGSRMGLGTRSSQDRAGRERAHGGGGRRKTQFALKPVNVFSPPRKLGLLASWLRICFL